MRIGNAMALGLALALAAGCGKKIDQKAIEAKVAEQWRRCTIVTVHDVVMESNDGKVVRYSYSLKMQADGSYAAPGHFPCPAPDVSLLAALANKNAPAIRKGEVITVTQEMAAK